MLPDGAPLAERMLWDGDVPAERRRSQPLASASLAHASGLDDARGQTRTYAFEGFEPLALLDGEEAAAMVECDQVGQPRLAVDREGALVWEGQFDAWGGDLGARGDLEVELRFPGQTADMESGLRYNRFRYYDGDLKTYTQTDPVGSHGGLRPHAYVVNPLGQVDCLGLGGCNWKKPKPRPVDSPHYSVAFEANLERGVDFPGMSDRHHFRQSNRQLDEAIRSDPAFARDMEALYPGISDHVSPGPRGGYSSKAPKDTSWHHHPDREGVMQLVPRSHHQAPGPVQQSLHPNQRGGMQNWGGGR